MTPLSLDLPLDGLGGVPACKIRCGDALAGTYSRLRAGEQILIIN